MKEELIKIIDKLSKEELRVLLVVALELLKK